MSTTNVALRISGSIFGIASLLHLARIITGVPVSVAGWLLPLWLNWMGIVATGFLCTWLWWLSSHRSDDASGYITDRNKYK